ncbi:MAG: type II methionyl aminopeptidase [Nanoarchaeota archaeon]|nr:type II methionyl aminopeptidase [Nanoarchaeota archaeon]
MENLDKWLLAGKIAGEVRDYAKSITKKGLLLRELADQVEQKIRELGGEPAFPVNLSMDTCAAHYTPTKDDETVLADQLLKIDVGVHVEGFIGDTATTVDLSGKYGKLIEAAEKALTDAIKAVKQDKSLGEIGTAIENAITGYGYNPVRNLSGHGLQEFVIHGKPTIPNFDTGDTEILERPQAIAIEPFATDGAGMIREKGEAMIFSQLGRGAVRTNISRQILKAIKPYNNLPFATRWLDFSKGQMTLGFRDLKMHKAVHAYPPLMEKGDGMVAQAEHTLILTEDQVIVSTDKNA